MLYRFGRILDVVSILIVLIIVGGSDTPRFTGSADRTRVYTREIEFDYPNWIWDATWVKIKQSTIGAPFILSRESNKELVFDYFRTTLNLNLTEHRIEQIYADPTIEDKENAIKLLQTQLDEFKDRQAELAPFAESVMQAQVSEILAELGITAIGQPLPPVLYHSSPTPLALIVSPRDKIEQTANISILPILTIDKQIELEDKIEEALDISTLTVPIGGVGVYPTMVMESLDLQWVLSTIAHEWIHNYLNVRPLGLNYATTPELRTMNETTASIAGDEIGLLVLQTYYPEWLASNSSQNLILVNEPYLPLNITDDPPPFDFRAEMHETRIRADELLAEGKIEEAEAYMEARRQFLWENGYLIRKLNQAYFAFHGAYADVPGGAAGEDPVGPAVRALREQSTSLKDFIKTISWMTSFEQLQEEIK